MEEQNPKDEKTFTEQIDILGSQLVQTVKDLVKDGNVRQLRIKASDGDTVFETPLTIGAVAGGVLALAAPWLAILGVIAALVTHVTVEVVRTVDDKDDGGDKPASS